jgi:hypothetical protein
MTGHMMLRKGYEEFNSVSLGSYFVEVITRGNEVLTHKQWLIGIVQDKMGRFNPL